MLMVKKSHKFLPSLYAHSFLFKNVYVCMYYFLLQLTFDILVPGVSIVTHLYNLRSDPPDMTARPIKSTNYFPMP